MQALAEQRARRQGRCLRWVAQRGEDRSAEWGEANSSEVQGSVFTAAQSRTCSPECTASSESAGSACKASSARRLSPSTTWPAACCLSLELALNSSCERWDSQGGRRRASSGWQSAGGSASRRSPFASCTAAAKSSTCCRSACSAAGNGRPKSSSALREGA